MREEEIMHKTIILAGMTLAVLGAPVVVAQNAAAPPAPMTFFVTSVGLNGGSANLGGLAGADKHCQALAQAAGAGGKTWRAYLSTQGAGAINARDRIGKGPWHGAKGGRVAQSVADLHGDTLETARLGNSLQKMTAPNEKGERVNGAGDTPNVHDILTGSQTDGTAYKDAADHTCSNWTSSAAEGSAQVGHHDRTGGPNVSWNSVHPSRGCGVENLKASGGAGLFYCFAID
jgi:hypothetical protein